MSDIATAIDQHTGLGVNEYGCVCGWKNPDGTDQAQLEHAAEQVMAVVWTPRVTEMARRAVQEVLPDLPIGKAVTVAIAALDAGRRAAGVGECCDHDAEAHNLAHEVDRVRGRLWRLASLAGWRPGNPADNDATAELYVTEALKTRPAADTERRVRAAGDVGGGRDE